MEKKTNRYKVIDDDLDEEERDIEAALERGEYVSAPDLPERIKEWKEAIVNSRRKKSITMRIQSRDLELIKVKALEEGMPYQTLISSILHKYAMGRLVTKS